MKIVVIGPTYPYKGGISHFTTILVNRLREQNDVSLITWKRQYPNFLYPVEQKDTTSQQEIKADSVPVLDFYNPFSWIKSALLIKKIKPEKLFITWVTPVQAPIYITVAVIVRFLTKTRISLLCHNALPHERKPYDLILAKSMFALVHEFIVHSEEDRDVVASFAKSKPIIKAFHPIYDDFNTGATYDTASIKNALNLKAKVILFFGYIRPYKGLEYLIEAMPEIKKNNPNTSLLVVGEFWSKDKPKYVNLIKSLGLEDDVVFIDRYVSNEEVGKYFSVSEVLVAPYISATQSGVIQIAYAFNLPVIATNVGGLGEVVEDNRTGMLIEPGDPLTIARAYESLMENRHLFSGVGKRASSLFSWGQYTDLIVK